MELFLLRHGEAGTHFKQGDDSKRPLTDDGIARMKRQAAALTGWQLGVDTLLSSPYTRAHQTAEIVGEALHLTVQDDDRLQAGFRLKDLRPVLKEHADSKGLMIAGHEPDLSALISDILGEGSFRMEKGGLARLRLKTLDPVTGTLIWLLTPEVMGAEATGRA